MNVPLSKKKAGTGKTGAAGLRKEIFFYLVLAFFAVFFPALGLSNEQYLRGTDAYYYALQAESWHETGEVRIPDSSILHPVIGSIVGFGLNGEVAVKTWVVCSLLLFSVIFYLFCFMKKLGPAALPLLLWPVLSPSLLFCALEFPKTFSFLIPFILALTVVKTERLSLLAALVLLALACALHKMAFVYSVAFLFGALCFFLPVSAEGSRKLARLALPGILTALGIIGLCLFLMPDSLHFADLQRLKDTRLTPGAVALFMEPGLPTAIKIEFIIAAIALPIICFKNGHGIRGILLAFCLILPSFIPAFGDEPFSAGERFGLLFPIMTALSGVFLLQGKDIEGNRWNGSRSILFILLTAVLLYGSQLRLDWSYPLRLSPPYTEYARMTDTLENKKIPMLITHRDIHYYYKYRTGGEAFSYEPEQHWPKEKIWRLVHGVSPTELYAYLPPECGWDDSMVTLFTETPYILLREDCYNGFRASVDKSQNPGLYAKLWTSATNPSTPRPAFLYKKHINDEKNEFSALPQHPADNGK